MSKWVTVPGPPSPYKRIGEIIEGLEPFRVKQNPMSVPGMAYTGLHDLPGQRPTQASAREQAQAWVQRANAMLPAGNKAKFTVMPESINSFIPQAPQIGAMGLVPHPTTGTLLRPIDFSFLNPQRQSPWGSAPKGGGVVENPETQAHSGWGAKRLHSRMAPWEVLLGIGSALFPALFPAIAANPIMRGIGAAKTVADIFDEGPAAIPGVTLGLTR